MITGTTNTRIQWAATLVALLLLAQPLAAAVDCWQESVAASRCNGDCDMPVHQGTVDPEGPSCCSISPTEPVAPAALSKALQGAKFSPDPDNARLMAADYLATPGFLRAEQGSAVVPADHSRQSLLCTFRI